MTVVSLAQERSRRDDGRCHHADCGGCYRVLCPYRGRHPFRCTHPVVVPARHYLLYGFLSQIAPPRCRVCGEHRYDRVPSRQLMDVALQFASMDH